VDGELITKDFGVYTNNHEIKRKNRVAEYAVLNAEKHNYIYMCAHPDFNGTHNFAVTLAEHNRNAAKYHVALRKWLAKKNQK
jgi:UPF0755 protein